ncbi:MAG TPA: hydroxyacylglutathione hydrolase [Bacteriovoracaceae bacterium]|nr:hydroxyacylglutathione hydrolase [Bacteriovoracaceae bacterium]
MILVKTFYAFNDLRNYSYLIYDDQTAHAWVIDPYEANPMIEYIKKKSLRLKGILNTHQHHDHTRGNAPLDAAFGCGIRKLRSSETVSLSQDHTLKTLDTPGHTMDHQVFIWQTQERPLALFSGDTLFNSGVGNCRNGGDVSYLYQTTMDLIGGLPPETLLYPGHDYRVRNLEFAVHVEPENPSVKSSLLVLAREKTHELPALTLGDEEKVNPFLRLASGELRANLKMQGSDDRDVFYKLRSMRDNW